MKDAILGEIEEGKFLAKSYSLENATTRILQSKFFSPAFNTAIFDGALRVYFSQSQEPEALKMYFSLQSKIFQETLKEEKNRKTFFIMIYPNKESFQQSFDEDSDFAFTKMEDDYVIGIQAPISDQTRDNILSYVKDNLRPDNFT